MVNSDILVGFMMLEKHVTIMRTIIFLANSKQSQFLLCFLVRITWKTCCNMPVLFVSFLARQSCITSSDICNYSESNLFLLQFPYTMFFLFTLGEVMEDLAFKLLRVTPSSFQPTHARNLGNKFACFVNYDSDLSKWQKMSVNNAKVITEYCQVNHAI